MTTMEITDKTIIQEAIRLVDDGISVTFPVKGQSMLPFIVGGRESVIFTLPRQVAVGQVVLAWVDGCRYVVHRIIDIDGVQVTLMGDGNINGTEHCTLQDVKALVTHVVDEKGRRRNLYSRPRRLAARLWRWLRPARRYILYIYKRL